MSDDEWRCSGCGASDLVAKQRAAKIYNATRKKGQKPVTRKSK